MRFGGPIWPFAIESDERLPRAALPARRPSPALRPGRGDPDPQSVFRWLGEGVPAGVRLQLEVEQLILAIPSPPADHG
jgi:hypothetical protein